MVKQNKIAVLYSGGKSLGGIEKYLIHLFESISDDFEIELLSMGNWKLTERMKILGYKTKIFSSDRIRFKSIKEIGKYCIDNKIDLIVSQGTVANAYARLISKKYKIKNLVTVHSDAKSEYPNIMINKTYQSIDKILKKYTTHYIAVSNYIKSILIKSGIPSRDISVIYNGADYPYAHKRDHKRLIIGSMGRLNQVKGYDILIKAFANLDNKRLRLKIAGEGEELDNLKQLSKELKVEDRVEFVGYKSDVFEFLDKIDVYIQSSRCEGFGVSLIEAMSQNIPVVVTPVGSLVEIVTDGQTGFISKDISPKSVAEAIKKATENIELSTKIGENAGKYVNDNFSTKKWINNTENVYKRVIK